MESFLTAAYSSYITFACVFACVCTCKCWNLLVSCFLWQNLIMNRIKNKKWKKTFSYLAPHNCGKILLNAPSVYFFYYIFFVMVKLALARLDSHCSTDWTQFSSPSLCPIDTKMVKQTNVELSDNLWKSCLTSVAHHWLRWALLGLRTLGVEGIRIITVIIVSLWRLSQAWASFPSALDR